MATALQALTAQDAMRTVVIGCDPEDRLTSLAASMVTHDVRAIMLPARGGSSPVVTDLDLVCTALHGTLDTPAREIARDLAPTVPSDAPLERCVAKMAEQYAAHVLVVDPASETPCGVISSFDVAWVVGGAPRKARAIDPRPVPSRAGRDELATVTVGSAIAPGVVACSPDASIAAAARRMTDRRIHCLAVAGVGVTGPHERHFEWGLIDDLDIVRAAHRNVLDEPVGSIAENGPLAVTADEPVRVAAALLVDNDARHLVVIGPDGLPSGILSTLDIAWLLAGGSRLR